MAWHQWDTSFWSTKNNKTRLMMFLKTFLMLLSTQSPEVFGNILLFYTFPFFDLFSWNFMLPCLYHVHLCLGAFKTFSGWERESLNTGELNTVFFSYATINTWLSLGGFLYFPRKRKKIITIKSSLKLFWFFMTGAKSPLSSC